MCQGPSPAVGTISSATAPVEPASPTARTATLWARPKPPSTRGSARWPDNGGPTQTHALLAGSPAIDAGDNVSVPATDQRGLGFPRKKDGNFNGVAVADIGAFER